MPAVAGYLGRIYITAGSTTASNIWRAHRWTVDWKIDEFDTTTFENTAVGVHTRGIADFTITADAYWDTTDNPFTAPINIQPGNTGSISIRVDKTNVVTSQWNFPNVLFTDVRMDSGVRDVIRLNLTAKASGYTSAQANITVPS